MPYQAALSLAGSPDAADAQRAHEELTRLGAMAVAHKVALRLRELGSPVQRPHSASFPSSWNLANLEIPVEHAALLLGVRVRPGALLPIAMCRADMHTRPAREAWTTGATRTPTRRAGTDARQVRERGFR